MSIRKTLLLWAGAWLIVITGLHAKLNPDAIEGMREYFDVMRGKKTVETERFKVGFLPVTCHLTCPVTDFINKQDKGEGLFQPLRFNSWPELKEAYLAKQTPATFILAPMAIALREQGVPIKIVYLGHRDGSAVMVHTDSNIRSMQDLRGKRVAVPNRYSNQRLLMFRALKQAGMTVDDIKLVEMPPPDMPAALHAKAVDAISSGEPFMGQTELDGYGRVLWLTKDVWPGFISCVLAVREDVIQNRRADVQALVDGIAKSGKWLDQNINNRMDAAQFVSKNYYMQDPRLLTFVLSKPPDRVKYTSLSPLRKDFEEIEMLGKASGILEGTARFDDYVDTSFAESANKSADSWNYQAPIHPVQ